MGLPMTSSAVDGLITSWNQGAEHIFGYTLFTEELRSALGRAETGFYFKCVKRLGMKTTPA